jgi:threonine/homoserine/homoserine lactone efflux protein
MTIELFTALAAFAFVSSITPGPNNLMLMASGTNFGFARTVPHMFGVCIGFTIMVILVGVGLMNLFQAYPLSFTILRVLSVCYLLFLAWKIATASPPSEGSTDRDPSRKPLTFLQAALFQWVNPKAWAMALTAISAYAPESGAFHGILLVAMILAAINLPSISTWVVLGTQLRRLMTEPLKLRIFNVVAALLLVGSLYPILFDSGLG